MKKNYQTPKTSDKNIMVKASVMASSLVINSDIQVEGSQALSKDNVLWEDDEE